MTILNIAYIAYLPKYIIINTYNKYEVYDTYYIDIY